MGKSILMIVAIALCMAFWNMKNENKAANEKATINQNEEKNDSASDEEKTLVTKILDQNKEVQQDSSNEVSPKMDIEEQVIDIVKNTNLAKKGESIGAYLQNTYGAEYQYSWSAKPFTDNVYIVEFFASQVRSEPYVYLFRVDMDQKKITGALNNITLDLLS